ncbi:MAG: hypothetical protein IK096_02295, partial [Lachnospiraceae bacterium]|nr:hypothetical protein [Lachnospiraceae bacterium]
MIRNSCENTYNTRHVSCQGLRKLLAFTAALAGALLLSGSTAQAGELPANVVQTDHQAYSYDEMREDILTLCAKYPSLLSWQSAGTTGQGREILKLRLGNPGAPHRVMIQSAIHAREYMTSQLTMEIIEYICDNYDALNCNGVPYSTLFNDTCFVILPMVNPDGVMISQLGAAGATKQYTKDWLALVQSMGGNPVQIKSNGSGVDLNRNFAQGFGQATPSRPTPWLYNYSGPSPLSESESRVLADVARSENFSCHINYHSAGNAMYYGSILSNAATLARTVTLYQTLKGYNGYKVIPIESTDK